MRNKIYTLLFLVFIVSLCNAQKLSEIIPPSPTATSIAQFADVPVSNYTGLPNIGIPIYTIKAGPLSVPISLQYHGGGIKVSQEASWVGLGWSLNCGGSISRMIKGNDDLDIHIASGITEIPYISSDNVPEAGAPEAVITQYYRHLIYNGHDPEPDLFFYNFGSFSGKFVIDKSISSLNEIVGRPLDIDAQAVKIRYFLLERLWVITDPMGVEYRFSVEETTTTYSDTFLSLTSTFINRNSQVYNSSSGTPLVTTWYIKEISSPIGKDKITFEYETDLHRTKSQIRVNEIVPRNIAQNITCNGNSSGASSPELPSVYSGSVDVTQDVYLKKINYPNGYVIFNTSDRIDLVPQNGTTVKPQRLWGISVYNNLSTLATVTANFNCDYFKRSDTDLETPEYHRLKLNSLVINDQNYQFEYNDPPTNNLPSKISLSIDDWGYFNNASNNSLNLGDPTSSVRGTLIPETTYSYQRQSLSGTQGADRYAYENYTKYFVLKKITLPTGGTQTFNWEANQYFGTKIVKNAHTGSLPYGVSNTTTSATGSTILSYTGPEFVITDALVNLNVNLYVIKDAPDYIPKMDEHPYFGYYKWENGVWNKYELPIGYFDIYNTTNPVNRNYNNTTLTPGRYKMFMSYLNNLRVSLFWKYTEISTTFNTGVEGSGLRIQSIEMNDGIKSIIKKYQYLTKDLSVSSGIPMQNPIHYLMFYIRNAVYWRGSYPSDYCLVSGDYLVGYSNNILTLSSSGDNFIGYDCVRSSYQGNTNLGETISEYYNFKPILIIPNPPPNFPIESDPRNGKSSRITVKNNNGKTTEETSYNYTVQSNYRKNTPGMFVYTSPWTNILPSDPDEYLPIPFCKNFYRYNNYTDWCYLQNETTVRYDLNGNNPISTTTQYSYENDTHNQPTKIITTDNQGSQTLETRMAYPLDLPNEPFASNLIAQYRKSIPLKVETFRGAEKLSEQTTKYGTFPSVTSGVVMTLPQFIWAKKGEVAANPLEKKVTYNYDDSGNIIEYTPESGVTTAIIWGYKKTQPIAKIENATYTSIPAATITNLQSLTDTSNATDSAQELLICNGLNALRTSFPNAMITTYTHKPNIGISTITDPKGDKIAYTYDAFGRLQNVKDKDGNILTENQYHYKN